jgi:hypothetical protein
MLVCDPSVLERLATDGLLEHRGGVYRTTRRWQSAMARAAFRILAEQGDGDDLRAPIVVALLEIYGEGIPDDHIIEDVEALLAVETLELDPREHLTRRGVPH